jgi:hypothetical protein
MNEEENTILNSEQFLKNFEEKLIKNEENFDDTTYNYLTANDIMNKEVKDCPLCKIHSLETPCGYIFNEFKECIQRTSKKNFNEIMKNKNIFDVNENDIKKNVEEKECDKIFEKFFNCFIYKLQSNPYYFIRSNLMLDFNTKELCDIYLKQQKYNSLKLAKEKE